MHNLFSATDVDCAHEDGRPGSAGSGRNGRWRWGTGRGVFLATLQVVGGRRADPFAHQAVATETELASFVLHLEAWGISDSLIGAL